MIELHDIYKYFGDKIVFEGLNFHVERGETHAVIGRSGEGKSVLLKHLSGLMTPDMGTVKVGGLPLFKRGKTRKEGLNWVRDNVSMVFQMAALFDSLTVYENVAFYHLEKKDMAKPEIDQLVNDLLEEVNLPDTGHLHPAELSGGMRKRVGLARALACQPQILLYDEPTTGLDPVTSEVINELIKSVGKAHDVTSVVITHDMKSAFSIADRISMLYEGRIIYTGTPDMVRNSEDPIVRQFVNGWARGPITEGESEDVKSRCSQVHDRTHITL